MSRTAILPYGPATTSIGFVARGEKKMNEQRYPKPRRVVDEAHLQKIREMPCAGCGHRAPSDPDHLQTRGAGGSDLFAVPLCRACHSRRHAIGTAAFEAEIGVSLWRVVATILANRLVEYQRRMVDDSLC